MVLKRMIFYFTVYRTWKLHGETIMLIITSNGLSNSRKPKRRVTYQPDKGKSITPKTIFELLKDQDKKETKRQQDLDRRFQDKLRNTAFAWRHSYKKAC